MANVDKSYLTKIIYFDIVVLLGCCVGIESIIGTFSGSPVRHVAEFGFQFGALFYLVLMNPPKFSGGNSKDETEELA